MKGKITVTTCRECGGELNDGDHYASGVRVHKVCLPAYVVKREKSRKKNPPKGWWEEPLPQKPGGLFDYDAYFKTDGYSTALAERPYGLEIFTPRYKFGAKRV